MPDKNGNLTRQEIDVLKQQAIALESLDTNFLNMEKIGIDTKEQRKDRDKSLEEIRLMIKTYEPLVSE